jgi:hypothetical protein
MTGLILLVTADVTMVARLLVIGTVVPMAMTVAARLHLLVTALSARTGTIGDFSQMSNVKRVSRSDM